MFTFLGVLLLSLPASPGAELTASMIEVTGKETYLEVLALLRRTGNLILDERPAAQPTVLHLTPGKYSFWKLLDAVMVQAKLQLQLRPDALALQPASAPATTWIAYDGPWRARVLRRSIIAYDDPTLNRLLLQLEISIEPRYLPLLLTQKSASVRWPGAEIVPVTSRSNYSFDGEYSRLVEVRLPVPPRSATKLDEFILTGDAWVAPQKLTFTTPLKVNASDTLHGTTFTIKEVNIQTGSKTWELATELRYPADSLEWESHQSRLLTSMKLTLSLGKQQLVDMGKDIRTDQGHLTTARWLFRPAPAQTTGWQATLTAPAAPIQVPIRLVFTGIELP